MTKFDLSTISLIALLAASPALAAPAAQSGDRRPAANSECTYDKGGKESRKDRSGRPIDCIVARGDASQDGRAVLRRSLEKQAKDGIGEAMRRTLKDLIKAERTS